MLWDILKLCHPEDLSYYYEITLIDYEKSHIIGKHKLDIRNKNDALTLIYLSYLDNTSIIEFYGKQFKVKDWNISYINQTIDIYI